MTDNKDTIAQLLIEFKDEKFNSKTHYACRLTWYVEQILDSLPKLGRWKVQDILLTLPQELKQKSCDNHYGLLQRTIERICSLVPEQQTIQEFAEEIFGGKMRSLTKEEMETEKEYEKKHYQVCPLVPADEEDYIVHMPPVSEQKMKVVPDGEVVARPLEWKKVEPEVFEEWSYNAEINVLKINGKPAYYQVARVANRMGASFWCGNQGMEVVDGEEEYYSLQEGQEACQRHYNRIIRENIWVPDKEEEDE